MPDTFTTNLHLTQPEVGASPDTWGTKLNADLVAVDALFGSTGTGVVVRHDASDNAATVGVTVSKAAGLGRWVQFLTSGVLRWLLGADTTAESGANAGSNFVIGRYDDGGNLLGASLSIVRATGVVGFEATPVVGANAVFHAGNSSSLAAVVGSIQMYGGGTDPPGGYWLACNGRALSRTTYSALFAAIGGAFGSGDGTTTFNIPNMAERVPIGVTAAISLITQDARNVGASFGEGTHALSTAELAAHTHSITDPGHNHTFTHNTSTITIAGAQQVVTMIATSGGGTTDTIATNTTGITATNSNGSGTAHNNVQPSIALNFIIRVLP